MNAFQALEEDTNFCLLPGPIRSRPGWWRQHCCSSMSICSGDPRQRPGLSWRCISGVGNGLFHFGGASAHSFPASLPQPWTSHLPHHQCLRVSEDGLKGMAQYSCWHFPQLGIICIHRSLFPAEAGQGDSRSCGKSVGCTALPQTGLGYEWGQGCPQAQTSCMLRDLISTKNKYLETQVPGRKGTGTATAF